jgi:beta-glucosidase
MTDIDRLLGEMTLAEKVGQMTQVEKYSITPDEVAEHGIGSVLSGGGGNPTPNTPETWTEMVAAFEEAAYRSRLGIPLLYGVDAVHGHTNVCGATIFPHNIGLGATADAELVRRVARVTAEELIATGVRWDFAPPVSVPQDIRWGRTLEAYSEDPELVTELGVAFLRGLQDVNGTNLSNPQAVLGCVKHFVADGGTAWGSAGKDIANEEATGGSGTSAEDISEERRRLLEEYENEFGEMYEHGRWGQRIDQGVAYFDEDELREVHLAPYVAALEAGARNIMVSLSSWRDVKLHGHEYLLTTVLKGELGFDGFLVSDWLALDGLDPDYYQATVMCINAGVDMVMVPHDWRLFASTLIKAVEAGDVAVERIDDAVRRILAVKAELGLFDGVQPDRGFSDSFGSAEHRTVAREAVAKSLVLLKNDGALPLARDVGLLFVAGEGAADMGLQCGGWTIEWRGLPGGDIPGTTLLDAVRKEVSAGTEVVYDAAGRFDNRVADVGLVVLAEPPYAEMTGDRADLTLPPKEIALIERVRSQCRTLVCVLYSGRPLIINDQLEHMDGFVASWLPGSEGAGVTDALFGTVPFSGRLPFAWPRDESQIPLSALESSARPPLWPRGHGLTTESTDTITSQGGVASG